jgi:hypothetical protein
MPGDRVPPAHAQHSPSRGNPVGLLSKSGPVVMMDFGPSPVPQPTVARVYRGAWTGEPKWICSSSYVGSMNLALARKRDGCEVWRSQAGGSPGAGQCCTGGAPLVPLHSDYDSLAGRISACQLVPRLLRGELPFDAGAGRVALPLPGLDLGDKDLTRTDSAIQTLPAHHADFDFHHVEPARVLRCVMILQALKHAVCLRCRESLVQGPGRVSGKIVHHHPDPVRVRIVHTSASSRMQSAKSRAGFPAECPRRRVAERIFRLDRQCERQAVRGAAGLPCPLTGGAGEPHCSPYRLGVRQRRGNHFGRSRRVSSRWLPACAITATAPRGSNRPDGAADAAISIAHWYSRADVRLSYMSRIVVLLIALSVFAALLVVDTGAMLGLAFSWATGGPPYRWILLCAPLVVAGLCGWGRKHWRRGGRNSGRTRAGPARLPHQPKTKRPRSSTPQDRRRKSVAVRGRR